MNTDIRIAILIMGAVLFLGIFELVRRRKFREELSIVWLIVGVGMIFSAFADFIIDPLSYMLGINYLALVVVMIATLFVFVMLYFSLVVSDLRTKNKELIQKMSLMDYKLKELKMNKHNPRHSKEISD